jgi:phosphopantetheinyl transferase (holo-ACP synthase)
MAIDIERCTPETARTARSFVSSDEIVLFTPLAWDDTICMTVQWSAKEALSKIMKFGLTVPSEILALSAVEATGSGSAVLRFRNFMQYKCHVWLGGGVALSLALPARTELFCDIESMMSMADWTAEHDGCRFGVERA